MGKTSQNPAVGKKNPKKATGQKALTPMGNLKRAAPTNTEEHIPAGKEGERCVIKDREKGR